MYNTNFLKEVAPLLGYQCDLQKLSVAYRQMDGVQTTSVLSYKTILTEKKIKVAKSAL